MARSGNVRVSITGDATGLKKATRDSETSLHRLGKSSSLTGRALRDIGHGAAYALGAGGFGGGMYALFDITQKSIKEFRESETVSRQTAAALKSTGDAAHISAKGVESLANAIKRKTAIDDETIQSGENMLLTFTKIRNEAGKGNDIFNRATQSITDMAVAMNRGATPSAEQLSKTAILVGKALNDPIKGSTALRRVGVDLDKQQQAQIKTLIAHGHQLQAQKIILRELTKEFGGSAAAQATSAKRLQVALGDLAEKVGGALAPVIEKASKKASVFIDQMVRGTGAGGRFADQMKSTAAALKSVGKVIGDVAGGLASVTRWFARASANVSLFVEDVKDGTRQTGTFGKKVHDVAAPVVGAFEKMAQAVAKVVSGVKWLIDHVSHIPKLPDANPFNNSGPGYKAPKGAPPYKKDSGPLRIVPPKARAGSVTAHASDFIPLPGTDFSSGSEPELRRRLTALSDYLGVDFTGISGARSPQHSVAVGGTANDPHTRGQAVDVGGGNIETVPESVLRRFGLTRPMQSWHGKDERNHIQLSGSPSGGKRGGGDTKIKWRTCELTWYDPALGGTNSGTGKQDANAPTASGELYNPAAFTCAAPSGYSFGTIIAFAYRGQTVACKVNDRGGAISGHHFDLSRAAATQLGIIGKGRVSAKFALPGKSKSIRKAKTPYDKLENLTGYIDLEQQAGVLTETQAAQQTVAAVNRALPNLHGSNRLRALGIRRGAQQTLRDTRTTRAETRRQTAADYAERKSGFYDRTLNNPWLQAYLDHQDYRVATGEIDQPTANAIKAKALQGAIDSGKLSESDVVSATATIRDLAPGDTGVSDEGALLAHIDAQVRAGDLTPEQGRQAKIGSIQAALDLWNLTDDARLELRGELKELTDAQTDATDAIKAQTDAMNALKDELKKQNDFATAVTTVSLGAAWKAMADLINGQIGGYAGAGGRALTAGAGNVVRY